MRLWSWRVVVDFQMNIQHAPAVSRHEENHGTCLADDARLVLRIFATRHRRNTRVFAGFGLNGFGALRMLVL